LSRVERLFRSTKTADLDLIMRRSKTISQFDTARRTAKVRSCFNPDTSEGAAAAATKRSREAADAAYRPVLKVATRDLGDAVEIRVRDNGTGIAPEQREKLFQPFFTTKPIGEGTGLGLSISYDIVTQQHRGTIEVDSAFGEFTEFTIRLPRTHRTAAEAAS
jgi:nitrogen-specific signal transduction histidine kinase